MRCGLRWTVMLLVLVVVLPAFAADEKKDDKPQAKPPEREKLYWTGEVAGKITKLESGSRNFSLHVESKVLQRNGKRGNSNYRVVTKGVDIGYHATDDVKVRTLDLPKKFDEKGNIAKYSKQEMDELKGPDKRLPGYVADFSQLRDGDIVKVYVSNHVTKVAEKEKGKDKDSAAMKARPDVVMVLILEPSKLPDKPARKPKKN